MRRLSTAAVASLLIVGLLWSCDRDREVTISFTGDVLLDRGVREQMDREGKEAFYDAIKSQLPPSDFLVGNLECPITETGSPVFKRFVFRGDTANLPFLKSLGFTHFTLANNHAYDYGRQGLRQTAQGLLEHLMVPMGWGIDPEIACEPFLIRSGDLDIFLFSSVWLKLENWMPLSNDIAICQERHLQLGERIKDLKKNHPGAIVIVNLHWGREYAEKPMPDQVQQAHHLIDQGADAIIGHHPHVLQPKEMYKGKPIYYSLGNFIFDQDCEPCQQTQLVTLHINNQQVTSTELEMQIIDCKPVRKEK